MACVGSASSLRAKILLLYLSRVIMFVAHSILGIYAKFKGRTAGNKIIFYCAPVPTALRYLTTSLSSTGDRPLCTSPQEY